MHPNRRPPASRAAREQMMREQAQREQAMREQMTRERMRQPQSQQQQARPLQHPLQRPPQRPGQRPPQHLSPVRGSVPSMPQPHIPARRTQYKSAFDTTCEERNTDVKEILKNEIDKVGDKDVIYRLHRGDSNLVNLGRGDVTDSYADPLERNQPPSPTYKPGSIYVPSSSSEPEPGINGIPRPAVFQGTPTSKPTKELIGISDVYIEFDSFNKLQPSEPSNGLLVFDIRNVNEENPIDSIIEMQIYPFFMPIIETDPTYQPNFYYYRRLTLAIQNITGTQFVKKLQNEKRWHFELEVLNAGSVFEVKPTVGEGKYVFTKPIRDLNIAEFRFRAPEKRVNIPTDCFDVTAVNPPDFGPGGNQRFETAIPHGLTVGTQVAVFFQNFNSNNSNFNAIINDEIGHIVDVVSSTKIQLTNTPSSTLLGSAVDSSGNPATARLCVGERRVRFTVRFRRILPSLTNWISP